MFEVIHAKHRKDYFRIAFKFWTSPQHVWDLAHGKHSKNDKDRKIKHELVEMGILHRHKHKDYYAPEEGNEQKIEKKCPKNLVY